MAEKKYPLNAIPLSVALSVSLVISTTMSTLAQQNVSVPLKGNPPNLISEQLQTGWNAFEPPVDRAPGRRVGGGTRGICPLGSQPLTAIIPESNLGRTGAEYPTILVYVPPTPAQTKMQFELTDDNNNTMYTQEFVSTGEGGIMRISIPKNENVPPLEAGKNYLWYFSLLCSSVDSSGAADASGNPVVMGWINRVQQTQDMQRQVDQANQNARPDIYAQQLLWYDAIASLADMRASDPNNRTLQKKWKNLLTEVGLSFVAEEPLEQVGVLPQ